MSVYSNQKSVIHSNLYAPHAIETVIRSVDGQHRSACIRFGHATVALEHDHLRPDLVVDLRPLVQHFLDVFLCVCVCNEEETMKSDDILIKFSNPTRLHHCTTARECTRESSWRHLGGDGGQPQRVSSRALTSHVHRHDICGRPMRASYNACNV